jgi:hypothetical protein
MPLIHLKAIFPCTSLTYGLCSPSAIFITLTTKNYPFEVNDYIDFLCWKDLRFDSYQMSELLFYSDTTSDRIYAIFLTMIFFI